MCSGVFVVEIEVALIHVPLGQLCQAGHWLVDR